MKSGVDFVGVGVGAVIVNKEGKILLTKRGSKTKSERGKWGFPGGGVEFGETVRQTVLREIKEELGIEIQIIEQLLSVDHILIDEEKHWVAVPFICRIKKGKVKILEPDKMSDFSWVAVKKIKKYDLTIVAKNLLPQLLEKFS